MLRQIRRIKNKTRIIRIRQLQTRGLIQRYFNEKGYVCYDTDELKHYDKICKRGRPSPNYKKDGKGE